MTDYSNILEVRVSKVRLHSSLWKYMNAFIESSIRNIETYLQVEVLNKQTNVFFVIFELFTLYYMYYMNYF